MRTGLTLTLGLGAALSAAASAGLAARWLWDSRLRRHAAARAAGAIGLRSRSWRQDLGAWSREAWHRSLPPRLLAWAEARLQRQGQAVGQASAWLLSSALWGLGGLLLALLLGAGPWSLALLPLAAVPSLRLRDASALRRRQLGRSLPEALDLLSACVQAGLGLDPALLRVSQSLPAGALRDELLRTLDELRLGRPRREAFLALERRAALRELGMVLRAILRSETRGVPLAPVLVAQSAQMRRLRSLAVQKAAAQAPVKMLLPLMGFILPVIFLVIFGPILLKLSELGF